ncbi:hypothetical protein BO71DRAFT_487117 [Aspergillus ellipticus CBS 707.79]|uniref:Uncharacterized protein n=1 Tax=Aspergillus ellipticus CBS 707.79 TaxID=1448320 RepID=A0A319DH42_9EURO|nr:hypothetical protein BO71DRAFT_487117 [Aspergillus ellipticus CBS 707.79]
MPVIQAFMPTGAYCVDITDAARLHVACLTDPNIENERVFAFGVPFLWNDHLAIFRKRFPERTFPGDLPDQPAEPRVLDLEPARRAEEVLVGMGTSGWSSLEEILMANTVYLV